MSRNRKIAPAPAGAPPDVGLFGDETKRSPFGATARFVGRLKGGAPRTIVVRLDPSYPLSEGLPALSPSVNSSLPSGVNLRTEWPASSVQYTESSGPMVIPCVRIVNMPSPHDPTNVPSRS